MSETIRAAEVEPVAAPAFLPRQAASRGKRRPLFSLVVQATALLGVGLGLIITLAGVPLLGRFALGPERAFGLALLVGMAWAAGWGAFGAGRAKRIALLEQTLAWLATTAVFLAVVAVASRGNGFETRVGIHPDVLYLLELLGNPFSGALVLAHVLFIAQLIGATSGYLLLGGGKLDANFGFEFHVARQHLRMSASKVGWVFLFGMVSPLLLLVWPLVLIGTTVLDARAESATRRRVLEQLMPYIAILGVSIGVCALVTVLSVMSGFEIDLKQKILGTNAHAVVLKYGNDFTNYREAAEKVRKVRRVKGAAPFMLNEVMLTSEQNIAGVLIKGIDPDSVGTVTDLPDHIAKGGQGKLEWLQTPEKIPTTAPRGDARRVMDELDSATGAAIEEAKRPSAGEPKPVDPIEALGGPVTVKRGVSVEPTPGIVLGRELARTLRVYVGDRINVVSPLGGELGPQGPMPKSRPFQVAAVFYSGMYEYDSKFAYIALGAAQKFFGTGDTASGLEIKVEDIDDTRMINKEILGALEGYPYHTKDWGQMNRNLFSALRLEKLAMAIMLTFIVLVACINILSTLVVFALQKAKEVAILKSMGARDTGIMKIFVLEGLMIGSIGTVVGLIQGYGCCLFVETFGIKLDPEVYYISKLPVKIEPMQFVAVALTAMVLAWVATIFPALTASRLRPVEGLKTE